MADGKRSKKKSKKNKSRLPTTPLPPKPVNQCGANSTETLEETWFWNYEGSDEKSQNLAALQLEVLGPFLFSQSSLCDEAMNLAKAKKLLPNDSSMWPMFFDIGLWSEITQMIGIVSAIVKLCESDHQMYQSILTGASTDLASLPRMVRDHMVIRDQCKGSRATSDEQIKLFYNIIKIQGANFDLRTQENKDVAASFFHSVKDKAKLVDPVKDRGNSNFKQLRFKAAIADYSTAIKLCPFNPVLYCNRALCSLRNEDYWHSCVDSFRALVLCPTWEKPYYRCAEAWHRLGKLTFAVEINKEGQVLAKSSAELQSQLFSFTGGEAVSAKTKNSKDTDDKATKKEKAKVKDRPPKMKVAAKSVKFEKLQCPELDARLSCAELHKFCDKVKWEWSNPASYFSTAGRPSQWEELQPEWVVPVPPTTDPLAEREPMMAKFEEIWCPLLADVEESLSIIPPTFQYFSDGNVMHSAMFEQHQQ